MLFFIMCHLFLTKTFNLWICHYKKTFLKKNFWKLFEYWPCIASLFSIFLEFLESFPFYLNFTENKHLILRYNWNKDAKKCSQSLHFLMIETISWNIKLHFKYNSPLRTQKMIIATRRMSPSWEFSVCNKHKVWKQ